ncbi:hypothetical protein Lalb_Chr09g0334081 [Lupinus albus]|uniref:Uncharacterized protein n=1 Tax=Lupinus albus TaxID=3870 RepID=A0A6A4Q1W6_LUPAL|nr:hypothetical protein Lalb_Chr09g0334081 [Lupinus albus]
MSHFVAIMVEGVGEFVKTIWSLQEKRWDDIVNVVTYVVVSVTMKFVLCLCSIRDHHRQRRSGMVFASF